MGDLQFLRNLRSQFFLLSVSKCPDRLARAIYAIKMAFMLQLKFI